jgi:hypothetical protein
MPKKAAPPPQPVKPEVDAQPKPKPKMGRPTKYDPSWMLDKIVEVGERGGSNAEMALELGISKDTFHEWVKKNPDFSEAVNRGELESQIWWETKGRAGMVGTLQGFNSTAFIFQMKNRFREDYRDVHRAEVTGANGGPIKTEGTIIDSAQLSAEHRAALRAVIEASREIADED